MITRRVVAEVPDPPYRLKQHNPLHQHNYRHSPELHRRRLSIKWKYSSNLTSYYDTRSPLISLEISPAKPRNKGLIAKILKKPEDTMGSVNSVLWGQRGCSLPVISPMNLNRKKFRLTKFLLSFLLSVWINKQNVAWIELRNFSF
jgi:hypothetical protein